LNLSDKEKTAAIAETNKRRYDERRALMFSDEMRNHIESLTDEERERFLENRYREVAEEIERKHPFPPYYFDDGFLLIVTHGDGIDAKITQAAMNGAVKMFEAAGTDNLATAFDARPQEEIDKLEDRALIIVKKHGKFVKTLNARKVKDILFNYNETWNTMQNTNGTAIYINGYVRIYLTARKFFEDKTFIFDGTTLGQAQGCDILISVPSVLSGDMSEADGLINMELTAAHETGHTLGLVPGNAGNEDDGAGCYRNHCKHKDCLMAQMQSHEDAVGMIGAVKDGELPLCPECRALLDAKIKSAPAFFEASERRPPWLGRSR
jgi:hypothetical protein